MKAKMERIKIQVPIPTLSGEGVDRTVTVEVPAIFDAAIGDYILGDEAQEAIDRTKARHMGLLAPDEIRQLRQALELTQAEMSDLLQLGRKTYTRWESGRERPSRSLNILLRSLWDGKVTTAYLREIQLVQHAHDPACSTPLRFTRPMAWVKIETPVEPTHESVTAAA